MQAVIVITAGEIASAVIIVLVVLVFLVKIGIYCLMNWLSQFKWIRDRLNRK